MNKKEFTKRVIESQKELTIITKSKKEIIVKAKRGPSKPTKIPLEMNNELAFFIAAIIGDGHLKKSKYQTVFEVQDKKLVLRMQEICKKNFNRIFSINERINKEKKYFVLYIDSKAIQNYLNYALEIPTGKKSHLVKVPNIVQKGSKSIKISFLQGIFATEGGNRRRGYGVSTASKQLWNDLVKLLEDLKITVKTDIWTHKKYKREYYGLVFRKEFLSKLSGDTEAVKRDRFRTYCA